jgi:hypothetical protein
VIQPVLPLHECADPTPAKSGAAREAAANPATNPACSSAALTKTFCLCVRV